MIETILQIQNGYYPFEERFIKKQSVKVEDVQVFGCLRDLLQKKGEMQKKTKLIESSYIIKLQHIYQQELTLHFIYEYVPYSLTNYIEKHNKSDNLNEMSSKLLIKKISYELTMLISYLAKMRIEMDLSLQNLGIAEDQKLKVYMSSRCKMGHKSEISLIANYGNCKEKIINFIQSQLSSFKQKDDNPPNFVIKGNKLVFPPSQLNESIYQNSGRSETVNDSYLSNPYESTFFTNNNFKNGGQAQNQSTASCIYPKIGKPSNLRQTQSPHFGRNINFSEAKNKSASKQPKYHKNSFQFGSKRGRQQKSYTECDDQDNSDAKSYTHSRSIRIQLEQKMDPNAKRKRKDSYKVKITTFHQYEMEDCDPQDLFGKNPQGEQDIFENIINKARKSERQSNTKNREQQEMEQDFEPSEPSEPSSAFLRKQSMPQHGYSSTNNSNRNNLQEKVRLAKQKAENLLSRYLKTKKSFN